MKRSITSFKYAYQGIKTAFFEEPNLKVHILLASLALVMGVLFGISKMEWLAVFLTIGVVVSVELTNTAIEEVVNSFTDQVHPAAKKAKDVAAGAVLVVSVLAVIIGSIVFLPYLFGLLYLFS